MRSGICLNGWDNDTEHFYYPDNNMKIRFTKSFSKRPIKLDLIREILIGLLFFCDQFHSFGQTCSFRGDSVLRIEIKSSAGYYNFNQRATIGKADSITLSPFSKGWQIDAYFQDQFRYEFKKERFALKRKPVKIKNKYIDNKLICNLLKELNCSYYPLNHTYFGFDSATFVVSSKAVKSKAQKTHRLRYKSSKSTACISVAQELSDVRLFDAFLKTEFDTAGYSIISDVWNEFNFSVITPSKTYFFQGKYPNTLKIPWHDLNFNNNLLPKNLLNPLINKYLILILPKKFYQIEQLQLDKIIDQYIEWYFAIKGEALNLSY